MRKPKPKVLIDTNILISGLVFLRGNEHKILKLAEERKIILVIPEFVLEEGRLVLARNFPSHEALLDASLARMEHTVLPWKGIGKLSSVCEEKVRDRKDAPLLASVIAVKPDFTVTGDVALREDMKRCSEVAGVTKICSSRQFIEAMG
ncbi:MAG: putative toxin-antitoxin system toxin component, PIN family [Candidatus Bathyarchaeia archaeon]